MWMSVKQWCVETGNKRIILIYEGFEVLTAVVMKSSILYDITPCSPLKEDKNCSSVKSVCVRGVRLQLWREMDRERAWEIGLCSYRVATSHVRARKTNISPLLPWPCYCSSYAIGIPWSIGSKHIQGTPFIAFTSERNILDNSNRSLLIQSRNV
jgi:hypothetical protein